jgi:hypothetical protein
MMIKTLRRAAAVNATTRGDNVDSKKGKPKKKLVVSKREDDMYLSKHVSGEDSGSSA